eukprot:scaffold105732_cov19-Tisochrysis_lutea.AAC.1
MNTTCFVQPATFLCFSAASPFWHSEAGLIMDAVRTELLSSMCLGLVRLQLALKVADAPDATRLNYYTFESSGENMTNSLGSVLPQRT